MEDNKTVVIYLFDEQDNDARAPLRNMISYLEGLHHLIDLYTTTHNFPSQDQVTDRIHILPLTGNGDPTPRFYVDFVLLGTITYPHATADIRTIRVPFGGDLYVRGAQIIRNTPNTEPLDVPLPKIEYDAVYQGNLSFFTHHLYQGLDSLEESVRNNNAFKIKTTIFNVIIMMAEAARNELVRAAALSRNRSIMGTTYDPAKLPNLEPNYFAHLRDLFDWDVRFNKDPAVLEKEEIEIKAREVVFGNNKELGSSLNRERYVKKTRNKKMTLPTSCKAYDTFDKNNEHDNDDFDEKGPPNFQSIEQKSDSFINSALKGYEDTAPNYSGKYKTTTPPGGNKRSIDIEIDRLQEIIDQDQQTVEVLIGTREESDDQKNRIKEKYGIDLNDEEVKEVAKSYREEVEESFLDKAKTYVGEGKFIKTNIIIRNITIKGTKYAATLINKLWPKVAKLIAQKLGPKVAGSIVAKKVPIISIGVGIGLGIGRFFKGDWKGGVCEITSGVVSTVPGGGTVVSGGIDAFLAGRDFVILQEKTQGLFTSYSNCVIDMSSNLETNKCNLLGMIAQSQAEEMREWVYVPST